MPRVSVSHLVGLPQSSSWSHTGIVECAKQTSLVYVLALTGDQASNMGQNLIQRFESLQISSAAELYGFLQQIIEQTSRQAVPMSLAVALVGEVKLVVATWRGSAVLRRAGVTSRLLSSASQIGILEGIFTGDDVLVLCSNGASHYQTELCQRLADGFGPEVVRQAIGAEIEHDTQSAGIAMTFVTAKITQPSIAVEIDTPEQTETDDFSIEEEAATDEVVTAPAASITDSQITATAKTNTRPITQYLMGFLKLLGNTVYGGLKKIDTGLVGLKQLRPQQIKYLGHGIKTLVLTLLSQLSWFWQVLTGRRVYLSTAKSQPRRIIILAILAGVLFVLLILSIWWWRGQVQAQAELAPFVASRENIESLISSDVFQARTAAINLRADLSNQITKPNLSQNSKRLTNQELTKVDKILLELAKKTELQELPVFLDLSIIKPGFLAELSAASATSAALLDASQKQLIQLNLADQSQKNVPVNLSTQPISLTLINNDKPVVLAGGIWSIETDPAQKLVDIGDSNRDASLLASFEDTLYVFNPAKRNIFRYVKSKDGYSKPAGWLIEPLGTEFENIVSIAVDGQVWLGSKQGEVKLFKAGRAQPFEIKGLAQPITHPILITTSPDKPDLYILDSQDSRMIIVDKVTGQVQKEIVSVSLKSVSALLLSSQGVYGVSGSLIYQLPD